MASSSEYIAFVCEQIEGTGAVRSRKMFGDYMIYVNDKPVLLVCDNTAYVKKLPAVAGLLQDAECGVPYDGAKEHYILDIENRELSREVVTALEAVTPLPKKKGKK